MNIPISRIFIHGTNVNIKYSKNDYKYKLYHTTSRILLLLHNAEAKLRQSVNNNDILRM